MCNVPSVSSRSDSRDIWLAYESFRSSDDEGLGEVRVSLKRRVKEYANLEASSIRYFIRIFEGLGTSKDRNRNVNFQVNVGRNSLSLDDNARMNESRSRKRQVFN